MIFFNLQLGDIIPKLENLLMNNKSSHMTTKITNISKLIGEFNNESNKNELLGYNSEPPLQIIKRKKKINDQINQNKKF